MTYALCRLRPNMCARRDNRGRIEDASAGWGPGASRCNVAATYPAIPHGKNYLPGVGGPEGKPGDRGFGQGGRASFTLYVLLGPSLAVGLALAGFSLMRDGGGRQPTPDPSSSATASPLVSPSNGAAASPTSPATGTSGTPKATPDTRTSPPPVAPTAAPTATPAATNPPTVAPGPSLPATPTPIPTSTLSLPTLPPLPTPVPTLPRGLP